MGNRLVRDGLALRCGPDGGVVRNHGFRSIRDSEVFRTIPLPGFFLAPPDVKHAERIPPDRLAAMQAWNQVWFAPRRARVIVLEDVYVTCEGLVFTWSLELVEPSIKQHTPEQVAWGRAAVEGAAGDGRVERVRGDVVLCRKSGATNYGHWMAEMLPKAWLAIQHWPGPLRFMIQAAAQPLRSVMQDSLAHLGIGVAACHEAGAAPVLVDRLILVDGLTEHGTYMSPLVADCLRAVGSSVPPARHERLLIVRDTVASRRFADEARLTDRAGRAGFLVFDPARLSLREQISVFKGARRVVGATGSAMTNIAFARPGSEVLMLAPAAMPDTFFWFIAELCNLRYREMRCKQTLPKLGPAEWDGSIVLDADDEDACIAPGDDRSAGWQSRRGLLEATINGCFDPGYYLADNADVAAAQMDPLTHFLAFGWREGRNPSARFSTRAYLDAYPDVLRAGMNPLVHFGLFGQLEGRLAQPVAAGDGALSRQP